VFGPVKAVIRRAALDDLRVTMTVVAWTWRLLRLSARTPRESQVAERVLLLLADARREIEQW
jgi:hypothetical protein